jgi:serine/threonine protein phosphatase PrpC
MVGVGAVGNPPVLRSKLKRGELLLLCSDGLHKFLSDVEMAASVGAQLRKGVKLREICRQLVEMALAHGSHDDTSALLIAGH